MIYFLHKLSKKSVGEREKEKERHDKKRHVTGRSRSRYESLRLDETNVVQDSRNVRRERKRSQREMDGEKERQRETDDGKRKEERKEEIGQERNGYVDKKKDAGST